MNKIKSLSQIQKILVPLKKEGKKIILCHGVFDVVHPGHIRYFKSAKKLGDILIVSITADKFVKKGPGRPFFNQNLRAEVLEALKDINYVAIVDAESASLAIKAIKPHFYVKGPDYKDRRQTRIPRKLKEEEMLVQKYGGKVFYTEGDVFSSSRVLNESLDSFSPEVKQFLVKFKRKYSEDYILNKLESVSKMKVLVIGDAIIDQYCYSDPLGKSSKEPIVVHKHLKEESYAGGALASANHVCALSENVDLITLLGSKKSYKSFIQKHLQKVKTTFFYRYNSQTIIKRRYIDSFTKQKLFQIAYLPDSPIQSKEEQNIYDYIAKNIRKYDCVIVNDFGHGFLTKKIIKLICKESKYLALNVQSNSANFGFNIITKYPRADFVCIDEMELRLATHDRYSSTHILMKDIFEKLKAKKIIVTKGPYGSYAYSKNDGYLRVPALTLKVLDRVGAGDALFAIASPCICHGLDLELTTFIGNVAASLKLQSIGNKMPLQLADIEKFITRLLK